MKMQSRLRTGIRLFTVLFTCGASVLAQQPAPAELPDSVPAAEAPATMPPAGVPAPVEAPAVLPAPAPTPPATYRAAAPLAPIAPASTFQSQPSPNALSDRVVAYAIQATLDGKEKTVTGSERITWRNPSDVPVSELQFHLYLNAFREGSTFIKESGGQLRGDEMPEGKYGQIDVTAMRIAGGEDLLPGLEYIHPDDDNAEDKSVARVPLPRPVAPGQSIEVEVEFVDKLPGVFARTGYHDDFYLVAQWFPKIGVFEPRGLRGRAEPGWNTHQFHANSEFYADFGTYDVELVVPTKYVVGATGELVSKEPAGDDTTRYRYHQEDVHDFAWTADDNYVVGKRTYSEAGFPPVEITALVQKEHEATVTRHLDICEKSLSWFNNNVGPYPYKVLTVVDPEAGAGGAGGMEYPTFITAGIFATSPNTLPEEDDGLLELVTFHEFGHQYWYGMVASNEFEEPWLDEGINSYTEALGMEEIWPEKNAFYIAFGGLNVWKLPVENPQLMMSRIAVLPFMARRGPLINTSWGFKGAYSYGANTYPRTASALGGLEVHVGRETMLRILQTYFERWKFRHPTSQDFFDVASEVSGEDLSWFFDQYFRSSAILDYAVLSVEPDDKKKTTEIALARNQDGLFPIHAVATRADGSTEALEWDGLAGQKLFEIPSESPVTRVEIYPGGYMPLDANMTNNTWIADTRAAGPARVASEWGIYFQQVLVLLSGAV